MSVPQPGAWLLCQAPGCGRPWVPEVHKDEEHDWLLVPGPTGLVVRCPRHLTRWACRKANVPWDKSTKAWIAEALANDLRRYPVATPSWEFPVPVEPDMLPKSKWDLGGPDADHRIGP